MLWQAQGIRCDEVGEAESTPKSPPSLLLKSPSPGNPQVFGDGLGLRSRAASQSVTWQQISQTLAIHPGALMTPMQGSPGGGTRCSGQDRARPSVTSPRRLCSTLYVAKTLLGCGPLSGLVRKSALIQELCVLINTVLLRVLSPVVSF